MKVNFFGMLMLVGILGTTDLCAQTPSGSKELQEIRANENYYREKLGLTETQHEKVKEINSAYVEDLADLKKMNTSKMTKLKTFRSLNEKRDKAMSDVLSKEQYRQYKTMQNELKKDLKERRKK